MSRLSLLEASLEAALETLTTLCRANTEYEETFTGAFMGAIAASGNLLQQFGFESRCSPIWWGSYSKHRGPDTKLTESGSGADFALCLLPAEGPARLIIFQAKRATIPKKDAGGPANLYADLHRLPENLEDGTERDPQIFMLAETGRRLSALSKLEPYVARESKDVLKALEESGADLEAVSGLSDLSWIHYLIYTKDEPVCVPLSKLAEYYKKELGRSRSITRYNLPGDSTKTLPLLKGGLDPSHAGWLTIDADTVVNELPKLAPLMPVVVGDSNGTHGLLLQEKYCFSQVGMPSSIRTLALRAEIRQLRKAAAANSPSAKPKPKGTETTPK
ncbi:hypothetical protein ABE424_17260 [Stenotrophomonas sp. TWI1149]|uniref:hypothetical protein n=1 Tax=unclassified Stenotrophomonas TaxID=196198 RepID=UPI00320A8217